MMLWLLLCILLLTNAAQAQDITTGLVGQWSFDAGAGTTAVDSVGSNPVTLSAASWAAPRLGTAAGHFDTPTPLSGTFATSLAQGKTDLTVGFWVRVTVTPTVDGSLLFESIAADTTTVRFQVGVQVARTLWCGGRRATLEGGAAFYRITTPTLTVGTWTHVTCVWNGTGGTLALYLDGAAVATTTSGAGTVGAFSASAPLALPRLGVAAAGAAYAWDLDALAVYNRALTASDVAALAAVADAPPLVLRRRLRN
jgi:hypothetical protein